MVVQTCISCKKTNINLSRHHQLIYLYRQAIKPYLHQLTIFEIS